MNKKLVVQFDWMDKRAYWDLPYYDGMKDVVFDKLWYSTY